MVKYMYHENILKGFKVMVCTKFYNSKFFTILQFGLHKILQFLESRGDNSWTKSVRVVILVPDITTQCPL